jgi:hypothetical protein
MGMHQSCGDADGFAIGAAIGAIVRTSTGDRRLAATILIGHGVPVLTLNAAIRGTAIETLAVRWAEARSADDRPGFYFRRTD